MQKTKLGISVGLLAAVIYFMGLLGGYTVTILLVGYVLLREENEWLKKNAVKAVVLMLVFSAAAAVINLIPNAINVIDYLVSMIGGSFYIPFISYFVSAVVAALGILEKVVFILLGLKALGEGTITIPVVDKMIEKYMA